MKMCRIEPKIYNYRNYSRPSVVKTAPMVIPTSHRMDSPPLSACPDLGWIGNGSTSPEKWMDTGRSVSRNYNLWDRFTTLRPTDGNQYWYYIRVKNDHETLVTRNRCDRVRTHWFFNLSSSLSPHSLTPPMPVRMVQQHPHPRGHHPWIGADISWGPTRLRPKMPL